MIVSESCQWGRTFLTTINQKGDNFEKNSNDYINNISYNVMYKF